MSQPAPNVNDPRTLDEQTTAGPARPAKPARVPSVLVWMDLEMTGLNPARDVIVEIATLVTDDELDIVAEGPDLVLAAPPEALDAMEDVVRQMHTRSAITYRSLGRYPCAATRSVWTAASSLSTCRSSKPTSTTVPSTCPR
jgi:oligoribonuclease